MWPQAPASESGWAAGAAANPFARPLPGGLSQQRESVTRDSAKSLSPPERVRGHGRGDYDSDDELAAYEARLDAET